MMHQTKNVIIDGNEGYQKAKNLYEIANARKC